MKNKLKNKTKTKFIYRDVILKFKKRKDRKNKHINCIDRSTK